MGLLFNFKISIMKNTFSILVVLLIFSSSMLSQITGKVIGVKDGDTVVILDDLKQQHTVRVADIDCPEKNQPFGNKAKWFTSDQIFGKNVTIEKKKYDKYGRIVGYVFYDQKNLSLELLKVGLAWHYKYYSKDKEMAFLERKARDEKVGLWSNVNPINPYEWRKGKRH